MGGKTAIKPCPISGRIVSEAVTPGRHAWLFVVAKLLIQKMFFALHGVASHLVILD
jgi:hypothetical protein